MNLADWKRREDLQARLDETLKEPHVVEALSVLQSLGLPQGTQVADITINALKNAYNEGYFKCLINLELLRSVKENEPRPMPREWQPTEKPAQ